MLLPMVPTWLKPVAPLVSESVKALGFSEA